MYVMIGRAQHKNQIKEICESLIAIKPFEMANIQLTDIQKELLSKLVMSNNEIAQAIINAMHKEPVPIADILKDFKESLVIPKQDYNQKHKPWKKERFYY